MGKWGELSPAVIWQIACEVREGKADPDDARRLLIRFCEIVRNMEDVPADLLAHFRDSFEGYLSGKQKSLESAFGLVRGRRGRRRAIDANERRVIFTARDVLLHRLSGDSLEEAAAKVAKSRHMGESQVREYWRNNKTRAVELLMISRSGRKPPYTPQEQKRLASIFRRHLQTGDFDRDLREDRWLILNPMPK